jgi:hypothetical protein
MHPDLQSATKPQNWKVRPILKIALSDYSPKSLKLQGVTNPQIGKVKPILKIAKCNQAPKKVWLLAKIATYPKKCKERPSSKITKLD